MSLILVVAMHINQQKRKFFQFDHLTSHQARKKYKMLFFLKTNIDNVGLCSVVCNFFLVLSIVSNIFRPVASRLTSFTPFTCKVFQISLFRLIFTGFWLLMNLLTGKTSSHVLQNTISTIVGITRPNNLLISENMWKAKTTSKTQPLIQFYRETEIY